MPVTAELCTICRRPLPGSSSLYCSNACKMRAYRRRQTEQRDAARQRDAGRLAQQREQVWRRLFIEQASLSQKQAARVFVLLDELGRIDGLPFEQLSLTEGPAG